MRAVFGVLSVLIVVLIVGLLVKKQLSPAPVKVAPADAGVTLPVPAAAPQQQVQQVRQQIESTLQQARPMPEDK
ncbi:hypothetical protein [Polaromonas sp. A23]|uniref:hypothetical protein n=1 Tax=Polaromonas sp. A23 TaxID=1944133 RepID=UPI00098527E8|nr:hypothetical protein [Polaromonas sp. A23]OOG39845.1 hypothetical protein B0B52_14585 [Polaromonas sp. A23]